MGRRRAPSTSRATHLPCRRSRRPARALPAGHRLDKAMEALQIGGGGGNGGGGINSSSPLGGGGGYAGNGLASIGGLGRLGCLTLAPRAARMAASSNSGGAAMSRRSTSNKQRKRLTSTLLGALLSISLSLYFYLPTSLRLV